MQNSQALIEINATNNTSHAFSEAQVSMERLGGSYDQLNKAAEEAIRLDQKRVAQISALVAATQQEAVTYNFTAREMALYKASSLGASAAQLQMINTSYDTIEAMEAQAKAAGRTGQQVGDSMHGMSRNARAGMQQMSYQIQDVAVQLQSGTSPFVVFSQQGSQIASVFGPGGAVIGAIIALSGALGASLLPKLFEADESMEKLIERTEESAESFKDLAQEQRDFLIQDAESKIEQNSAALVELQDKAVAAADALQMYNDIVAAAKGGGAVPAQTVMLLGPLQELIDTAPRLGAEIKNLEGETEALIEKLLQLNNPNEMAKKDAEEMIAALREEAEMFGMTASQIAVYKAQKAGMKPEDVAEVIRFRVEIDRKTDEQEEADRLAKEIADQQEQARKDKEKRDQEFRDTQLENDMRVAEQQYEDSQRQFERQLEAKKAHEDAVTKIEEDAREARKDLKLAGEELLEGEEAIRASYARRLEIIRTNIILAGEEEAEYQGLINATKMAMEEEVTEHLADEENKRAKLRSDGLKAFSDNLNRQVTSLAAAFDDSTAMGKAFFLVQQGMAAANAVISGLSAAASIREAYAKLAAQSGQPALAAAGEAQANISVALGFATAGAIMGQTMASFEGGGFTGYGARAGGLDGKGGFPAILHPNETVTDHESGGSAPAVNINISAVDQRGVADFFTQNRSLLYKEVRRAMNNRGRDL